ncbi:DciA family protein [Caulobacter sp. 17J65-9]|uniref:DUF721 domain-containing protein n=1 Tax=Caulobacter sp. 17J65-9 TaxID=2709382 RepID=UPI0013C7B4E3|nr:DciA family protein [Caulobacter sp. 17J65-9]NEX93486.1 DUF721 domain-containing protein [Caulobacter sp. 17J65-9]
MPRRLPTPEETMRILAQKRTRPARKPPRTAGRSLAKFIKTMDEKFGQGPGVLQARWREIVGERLSRQTEPVKLTKGRAGAPGALEIRVAGPAAALIQHQTGEILERVNLYLGAGAVGRLRIVQGPVKAQALPPSAGGRKRRSVPLDAAAEAELSASLDNAPEGPMKDALLRLGRGVLRNDPERR